MKTSLSVLMGGEIFRRKPKKSHKVLLVDADPQKSLSAWRNFAKERGVDDSIWPDIAIYKEPILHHPNEIPAKSERYDYCIIDTPPHDSGMTSSALVISDFALIPISPSELDTEETIKTIELILEAQEVNPVLRAAMIITKKIPRTLIGEDIRKFLNTSLFHEIPVLASDTYIRAAYAEVAGSGQMLHTYAPRSKANQEIRAIVNEVIKNYG